MTFQIVNVGSTANALDGDSLRTAFIKINANFQEVQNLVGGDLSGWLVINNHYQANVGEKIIADTTVNPINLILPANPAVGVSVAIADGGDFSVNPLIIKSLETVEGYTDDIIVNIKRLYIQLIFNGETWKIVSSLGVQGPAGPRGPLGPQGNIGPQGVQGLVGPIGNQGLQGIQGAQGIPGEFAGQGIQGVQGVPGEQGIQGIQGLDGAFAGQGIQGVQGLKGDDGSGVPPGGLQGQVLAKASATDGDVEWIDPPVDAITEVSEDPSPSLGGDLDLANRNVVSNGTVLLDGSNASINLDGTVKGNIIPDQNEVYDLGSPSRRFNDLYLSGTTIILGETSISSTEGFLDLPLDTRVGGVSIGLLTIKGSVVEASLLPYVPEPIKGDAYVVLNPSPAHLWTYDGTTYVDLGNFQGPQGIQGTQGTQGTAGNQGIQGISGPNLINNAIDVDISGLKNGAVLVYKTDSSKWEATTVLEQQDISGGHY